MATENTSLCPQCEKPLDLKNPHRQSCGHNSSFVKEPPSPFVCPICHEVFLDEECVVTPCQHTFDRKCISQALSLKPECPIDRRPLNNPKLQPNILLAQGAQRLQVECLFKKKGCEWKGELQQVADHVLTSCSFSILACKMFSFGCEWKGKPIEVAEHEKACVFLKIAKFFEKDQTEKATLQQKIEGLTSQIEGLTSEIAGLKSEIKDLKSEKKH